MKVSLSFIAMFKNKKVKWNRILSQTPIHTSSDKQKRTEIYEMSTF